VTHALPALHRRTIFVHIALAAVLVAGCSKQSPVAPTTTNPPAGPPVDPAKYTVTAGSRVVSAGDSLTVSWTAPGGTFDWIGMYRSGDPDSDHGWTGETHGAASGTLTLNAPFQEGYYEFRYFLNGSIDVARSAAVTVLP